MNAPKEIWAFYSILSSWGLSLTIPSKNLRCRTKYIREDLLQDPAFLAENGLCRVEEVERLAGTLIAIQVELKSRSYSINSTMNMKIIKWIKEALKPSPPEERE